MKEKLFYFLLKKPSVSLLHFVDLILKGKIDRFTYIRFECSNFLWKFIPFSFSDNYNFYFIKKQFKSIRCITSVKISIMRGTLSNTAVKRLRMCELSFELRFFSQKNSKKLSYNIRKILKNSLPYISSCFLIFFVFLNSLLCIQFAFVFFPRFS